MILLSMRGGLSIEGDLHKELHEKTKSTLQICGLIVPTGTEEE